MRNATLLCGALLLGALIVLGRSPEAPAPSVDALVGGAPQTQPAPAAAASQLLRRDAQERLLSVQDKLTGAQLELELELLAPEAEAVAWAAGSSGNLSRFPAETAVSYKLTDGSSHSVRLQDCLVENSELWLLSIPYSCRLVLELPDGELSNGDGNFFLCRRPGDGEVAREATTLRGPFDEPNVPMTAAGALNWNLRCHRSVVLLEAAAVATHEIAASGVAVLALHLADGRSGYAECELLPGEEVRLRPELHARPHISGTLLDASGQPVANAVVRLAVSLDLGEYDFRSSDPDGLIALRREGVLHHSLARRMKTDADGRFAVIAPRGREYAVYTHALGGYAMWSSSAESSPRGSHEGIVLQLLDPSDESAVSVTVLRPDGSPLSGASVQVAPVADLPFFRQWPDDVMTAEDGSLRVLGLEIGGSIALLIRHPDLNKGRYGTQPYLVIPSSRILTVVVPEENMDNTLVAVRG